MAISIIFIRECKIRYDQTVTGRGDCLGDEIPRGTAREKFIEPNFIR